MFHQLYLKINYLKMNDQERELLLMFLNFIEAHYPIEFESPEDVIDYFEAKRLTNQ